MILYVWLCMQYLILWCRDCKVWSSIKSVLSDLHHSPSNLCRNHWPSFSVGFCISWWWRWHNWLVRLPPGSPPRTLSGRSGWSFHHLQSSSKYFLNLTEHFWWIMNWPKRWFIIIFDSSLPELGWTGINQWGNNYQQIIIISYQAWLRGK